MTAKEWANEILSNSIMEDTRLVRAVINDLSALERLCVERERAAFVAGWKAGQYETENGERYDGNFEPEDELDRRYPLPKEE